MTKTPDPPPVVLLAEDEVPMLEMERRILESGGYQVVTAGNGGEALARLNENRQIGLLVADIEMPEITGDDLARLVKGHRPGLKVLFVSGNTRRLFEGQSLLAEDEAYLDKPFTAVGLLEAVSMLLYGTRTPPWK